MMAWLTILPFALWDTCGWAMLPVMAIVAFVLLGEAVPARVSLPACVLRAHGCERSQLEEADSPCLAQHS